MKIEEVTKILTWYEWSVSDQPDAREYRIRLTHGEAGNPENPAFASQLAYDAGMRAGLQLAAQRITRVVAGQGAA